ncbi:hypothetical protein EDB85DRAFT_1923407 [Lactarius pseudohatsudake]|nr:hypothetical protein EDB85DRAFT_1923407 [Lactarius pseudohatsudake]
MTDDTRLELASTLVWEYLGHLRGGIIDVFVRGSDEDKANMRDLLVKIDAVYNLRLSSIQEYNPSEHVQSQTPGTSAIVQPNPPFRGPMSANGRSSYASTSTAQAVGGSWFQGDNLGGITPAPFKYSSSRFLNLYSNPHPLFPSQIGPGGVTAHSFSASLPTLSPPGLGSTDITSPGVPSVQHPLPHMRHNEQDRRALVYYPPIGFPIPAVRLPLGIAAATLPGITPAPFNHSSGGFPNLYSNPYPLLPSQIRPSGVTAHTSSAPFLPTPFPYMRHNEQDRRAPVYYPPGSNF